MAQQQELQDTPIRSIYPEVNAEYDKHPEMEYWIKAIDRVFRYFSIMSEGKQKKRRIDSLYRVQGSEGKEFLYWSQTLLSEDYMGNEITFDSLQGKVSVPKFRFSYIAEESRIMATEVDREEIVYNTPNTPENLKALLADCTDNTAFAIDTGPRIFSVSRNSFVEDSFDDAASFGRTGKKSH